MHAFQIVALQEVEVQWQELNCWGYDIEGFTCDLLDHFSIVGLCCH